MSTARMILAALSLACVTGPALAQDTSANPTYTTMNLQAGFPNDPRTVNVQSGGSIDASHLGNGCRGFVARAPDVRVNYRAGSLPLIFSVASGSDTTLVINGPDGRWYCDDDSGEGNNPSVRFSNPGSGQYDVWIGTYGGSELRPARLHVSEVSSQ